jgi:N-acetylneuraminate synthase
MVKTQLTEVEADSKDCTLVAEIGCNHMGDFALAKKFIDIADSFCDVRYVKFQKRNVRELLSPEQYAAPHPVPANAFGDTYGAHREFLEFDLDQHRELKRYCEERGLVYACSVWDIVSFREIASLEPEYIKIPSATNTHLELLDFACREFGGKIHLSLGMTTRVEEAQIIELFRRRRRMKDLVVYACTSGYPIEPQQACLLEIPRLIEAYGDEVAAIGYSGHHKGIGIDIVAVTLGARYIERHFTLDRTWKGTDHAASLEPDGLRRLNRNIHEALAALRCKDSEILAIEEDQRRKLKWGAPKAPISSHA